MVVSEPFTGNAKAMARLQGIPDYPYIVFPHPLSSLTEGETEEIVRRFFPRILELLLARHDVAAG